MQKCLSAKTRTFCIANQLTGFLMTRAIFTERYSRTDYNVFSEIPFNKSSCYIGTSQFIYIENRFTGFCKAQASTEKYFILINELEEVLQSHILQIIWTNYIHWQDCSTVTGTIAQQSLGLLFNSPWRNSSAVTGTILQQLLAQFFNSHGQDFFFFLCWQNSSTVKITVEELWHIPGIRPMIQ